MPERAMGLLGAVWLIGCGAAQSVAPVAAPGEPFLAMRFESTLPMHLVELHVTLDGAPIFDRSIEVLESGDYEPIATPLCVARVPLAPGPHHVRVDATYRGHGYGVFAYLRGHRLPLWGETDVELSPGDVGIVLEGVAIDGYEATHHPEGPREVRLSVERASDGAGCWP